jgi:formate/nitrite transporter FocA (FNT family)
MATPTPQREPARGTRFSEAEIHANVVDAADVELERRAAELAWSGVESGLALGFSFVVGAWAASQVPPAWASAVVAAAYPLGFVFVVLSRSQLFTENTLEPIVPLLARRDRPTLARVVRLWAIVLPTNLLGALLFALAAARTPMLDAGLRASLAAVAEHGTSGGFALVAWKAVFAGWLVASMAWLVASTRATGAQIALVWLTTAPISALGFRHSIAGAVEAFYRAAAGQAGWGEMTAAFLVPAILGNVVGGVLLVALLHRGQVRASD